MIVKATKNRNNNENQTNFRATTCRTIGKLVELRMSAHSKPRGGSGFTSGDHTQGTQQ